MPRNGSSVTSDDMTDRQDLMEKASLWFTRLDSGSADIDEFEAWRDADPRNAAAFARIAGVGFQLDRLKKLMPAPVTPTSDNKPNRRAIVAVAVGAAGIGAIGVIGTGLSFVTSRAKASTMVSESREITLPDGGTLTLNTDSAASWKFDGKRRRIWLERGEIALVVQKDSHPWLLYGGGGVVRIGEGDINARLRGQSLDLTVVKGVCSIERSAGSDATHPLSDTGVSIAAGQAALVQANEAHVRSVDPEDMQFISGWRRGELVFDGQTLGSAVAEYNRYLPKKIVVLDASLENIRLGGRFKTHDPADFLAALRSGFGIHVAYDDSGSVMLSK